jgi:hypothetical protein
VLSHQHIHIVFDTAVEEPFDCAKEESWWRIV